MGKPRTLLTPKATFYVSEERDIELERARDFYDFLYDNGITQINSNVRYCGLSGHLSLLETLPLFPPNLHDYRGQEVTLRLQCKPSASGYRIILEDIYTNNPTLPKHGLAIQ